MTFDTPVLLLAWRRPDAIAAVIDALRPIAPARVFVACDGPDAGRPGEAERVAATRAAIERGIDWPCRIERLFAPANQGCRLGVSRAITWFFEHVDEGIILEDDCVPHRDFLPYCAALLERYRHDTRVWCIAGDNSARIPLASADYSYGFISYPLIWGWATWRRCWTQYRFGFDDLEEIAAVDSYARGLFNSNASLARWRFGFWRSVLHGTGLDSWAAAWSYTCMINSGLTILPRSNLISNIGYGDLATHTTGTGEGRANAATESILPLSHPPYMIRDLFAEQFYERVIYRHPPARPNVVQRAAGMVGRMLGGARS